MATHDFGLTWLGNGGQQVQYCRETYSKAVETLVCNSGEPSSVTSFTHILMILITAYFWREKYKKKDRSWLASLAWLE